MTSEPILVLRSLGAALARLPVIALVVLAGCNVIPAPQEDLTRYYVLGAPSVPAESLSKGLAIGIKAVGVATYLNKREIVVRVADNEVSFRDGDRWAEPIDTGIAHVVRARLLSAPGIRQVYLAPLPIDTPRDYDVTIEITRCEGVRLDSGAYAARFGAVIELRKTSSGDDSVVRKVFQADDRPWDGHSYGQLVGLLGKDAEAMADFLAAAITP